MISPDTICQRADTALSSVEDGKASIMDIANGTYFDLEETGAMIWEMIENPLSFEDLCKSLAEQFSAPLQEVTQDVAAFLKELQEQNLVILHKSSCMIAKFLSLRGFFK